MSAIFGIINKTGKPIEEATIQKIQGSLIHRAVDGSGTWHSDCLFLGHHKLIIYPEQEREQLPSEEDDLVITADCRIDNRDELIHIFDIKNSDHFRVTDSGLILAAYRKWEEKCTDHIEGEFAFAVWNKKTQTLFCAVDHIGFRPFYYYDTPSLFVFSSEMKGILAVKETPDLFNEASLIDYFFRQSDQTKTHNDEIFALCGGHKLIAYHNRICIERYWNPQPLGKYHFKRDEDWAECLRELLFQSVEYRLRTNLPVGIGLSGGLDSSAIACIAGKILEKKNQPLYAFSSVLPAGHPGIERDERKYIAIMGDHIKNLDQTFVEAREVGPFSNLEQTFATDETFPNPFHYMDQAILITVKERQIGLFLSGYGGDFFVSDKGNEVIYELIKKFDFCKAVKLINRLKYNEKRSYYTLLKCEIARQTKIGKAFISWKHRNEINWQRDAMLNEDFYGGYRQNLNFDYISHPVRFMLEYIESGRPGRVMGMWANRHGAYNMESGVPLFDKKINEFMFDVPIEQYLVGGNRRSLLRRAMEGILPPEIQWRKDKLPYTPDFHRRIIKEKQFIGAILNDPSYRFTWNYIDKNKIEHHIQGIKPVAVIGDWMTNGGNRLAQGIIAVCFLDWLKKNNYIGMAD